MAAQTTEEIKTERGEGESTGADVGNRITPTPGRGRTDFPTGTSGGQAFGPDMPLASKRERERDFFHITRSPRPQTATGAKVAGDLTHPPCPGEEGERERERDKPQAQRKRREGQRDRDGYCYKPRLTCSSILTFVTVKHSTTFDFA